MPLLAGLLQLMFSRLAGWFATKFGVQMGMKIAAVTVIGALITAVALAIRGAIAFISGVVLPSWPGVELGLYSMNTDALSSVIGAVVVIEAAVSSYSFGRTMQQALTS